VSIDAACAVLTFDVPPTQAPLTRGFLCAREWQPKPADRLNVHGLLEKNGTPEEGPEGQVLIARGRSWAEKLLRRHEARVGRVAKRLLQPPHKMNPARFKQLMQEG
jgi:hypothetical protein